MGKTPYLCCPFYKRLLFRGVAQLASASGLGPEGPVFESQYPDTTRATVLAAFVFMPFSRCVMRARQMMLEILIRCTDFAYFHAGFLTII